MIAQTQPTRPVYTLAPREGETIGRGPYLHRCAIWHNDLQYSESIYVRVSNPCLAAIQKAVRSAGYQGWTVTLFQLQ